MKEGTAVRKDRHFCAVDYRLQKWRNFREDVSLCCSEHAPYESANEQRLQPRRPNNKSRHAHTNALCPALKGTGHRLPPLLYGNLLPHLRRDWAHRCHICTGTGPTLTTSAPGLGSPLTTSAPCLELRRCIFVGCEWHCKHFVCTAELRSRLAQRRLG